jgi:ACS family pantothenate transporter-like MFS transporter
MVFHNLFKRSTDASESEPDAAFEPEEKTRVAPPQIAIPFNKCWELFWSKKSPPKQPKQKWFFWYPPEQSSRERKIVFKLDCSIMTYVCLAYFTRYLDAQNVASAYITGMKEDLNISGEQYVWLNQLFSSGYCVSGAVSTVILTKVRFSRIIPVLEFLWALMCLLIFTAKNFGTVAALRFIQGVCEGAAWPAIHYVIGSWYTKKELGKRTAIFTASGPVGVILSGLIQSGLQKSMNGRSGLEGWRWLFIMDAVITFPIAILGFFVFPDTPELAKPKWYLSQEEIDICRERIKVNGTERTNKLDLSVLRRVFTGYQWYLFVIAWILWVYTGQISGYLGIVLKSLGYNVYDRNNIPTGIAGVGIVSAIISGFVIDMLGGRRIEIALFLTLIWIIGNSLIRAFDIPVGALITGYMLTGVFYAVSPVIVGWCNELTKEDNQKRAVTIGCLNLFGGLLAIPYALKLFDADYTPRFTKGATGCVITSVLLFFYFFVILAFDRYQNRKREYIAALKVENFSEEEADVFHLEDNVEQKA